MIRVFALATSQIRIKGTEVVPFPLFRVLDGSDTRDYVERVEPSPQGGAKMARALMDAVLGVNLDYWTASTSRSTSDIDAHIKCDRSANLAEGQAITRDH